MDRAKLYGTWKLLSIQFANSATGERRDMYGPDPQGYIVMTPDNRMMTVITSGDRTAAGGDSDGALFGSMMAYCGPFRIEGNVFITQVEVAWHPSWVGTEQGRTFSIEDDILSITSAEVAHPMFPGQPGRGIIRWQRASAF